MSTTTLPLSQKTNSAKIDVLRTETLGVAPSGFHKLRPPPPGIPKLPTRTRTRHFRTPSNLKFIIKFLVASAPSGPRLRDNEKLMLRQISSSPDGQGQPTNTQRTPGSTETLTICIHPVCLVIIHGHRTAAPGSGRLFPGRRGKWNFNENSCLLLWGR